MAILGMLLGELLIERIWDDHFFAIALLACGVCQLTAALSGYCLLSGHTNSGYEILDQDSKPDVGPLATAVKENDPLTVAILGKLSDLNAPDSEGMARIWVDLGTDVSTLHASKGLAASLAKDDWNLIEKCSELGVRPTTVCTQAAGAFADFNDTTKEIVDAGGYCIPNEDRICVDVYTRGRCSADASGTRSICYLEPYYLEPVWYQTCHEGRKVVMGPEDCEDSRRSV